MIKSVAELAEFVLCEDNDSPAFAYLRGMAVWLAGRTPDSDELGLIGNVVYQDRDFVPLVLQVSGVTVKPYFQVMRELMDELNRQQQAHDHA